MFILFSISQTLSHTHTHTQVHSVLVFTLPSVCVFYLFLYSLQLFSYRHGCYLGRLAFYLSFFLNTPFLSYSLPPSFSFLTLFFFLCFCLLLSFSLSFPTTPPSLSYLSVVLSLTHSVSFGLSSPAAPPSHSSFPLTLSLSLLSFLTQSISHSPFLSLPSSLASSITLFTHSPLTHSSFFLSVSPSLCLTALKAVIINYMVIRASRFPFSFLAPLFSAPPPPHTHTHNLFSFYFPCLCLSVSLSLSVAPSLFPLYMVVFLILNPYCVAFFFSRTNQGTSSLEVIMCVNDFLRTLHDSDLSILRHGKVTWANSSTKFPLINP